MYTCFVLSRFDGDATTTALNPHGPRANVTVTAYLIHPKTTHKRSSLVVVQLFHTNHQHHPHKTPQPWHALSLSAFCWPCCSLRWQQSARCCRRSGRPTVADAATMPVAGRGTVRILLCPTVGVHACICKCAHSLNPDPVCSQCAHASAARPSLWAVRADSELVQW